MVIDTTEKTEAEREGGVGRRWQGKALPPDADPRVCELWCRRDAGDPAAAGELAAHYAVVVRVFGKRWSRNKQCTRLIEDLVGEGMVVLMRSLRYFKVGRSRFTTYLIRSLCRAWRDYVLLGDKLVRVPREAVYSGRREPAACLSMDATLRRDGAKTFHDWIPDGDAVRPDAEAQAREERREVRRQCAVALRAMSPRQRRVCRERFLLGLATDEMMARRGVTRQAVNFQLLKGLEHGRRALGRREGAAAPTALLSSTGHRKTLSPAEERRVVDLVAQGDKYWQVARRFQITETRVGDIWAEHRRRRQGEAAA